VTTKTTDPFGSASSVTETRARVFAYEPATFGKQEKTYGPSSSTGPVLTVNSGSDASGNVDRTQSEDMTTGEVGPQTSVVKGCQGVLPVPTATPAASGRREPQTGPEEAQAVAPVDGSGGHQGLPSPHGPMTPVPGHGYVQFCVWLRVSILTSPESA